MAGHENPKEPVPLDDDAPRQDGGSRDERRSTDSNSGEVESENDRRKREDEAGHAAVDDQDRRAGVEEQEDHQRQGRSDVRSGVRPERDVESRRGEEREPAGSGEDADEPGELSDGAEPPSDRSVAVVLEGVVAELSPPRREELEHILVSLVEDSVASSWSAPLPEASDFYKYDPADRERIMLWNDAGTSDESVRQNKLVDARIAEAKAGPRRAIAIVLICLLLAAVAAFWLESVVTAALFLSPPLIMFAQQLIASVSGGAEGSNGDRA